MHEYLTPSLETATTGIILMNAPKSQGSKHLIILLNMNNPFYIEITFYRLYNILLHSTVSFIESRMVTLLVWVFICGVFSGFLIIKDLNIR